MVRTSRNAGTQLVRAGKGRWSAKAEERFFLELGATANIRRSAAAAGFSTTALYGRRARSPEFRARGAAARQQGRARIDMMLIEAAEWALSPEAEDAPEGLPKVTVAEAIAILRLRPPDEEGGGARRGLKYGPKPPSIEEVRANILRKLDAIEAHEKRKTADPGSSPG